MSYEVESKVVDTDTIQSVDSKGTQIEIDGNELGHEVSKDGRYVRRPRRGKGLSIPISTISSHVIPLKSAQTRV